jgi:hypothetical protein
MLKFVDLRAYISTTDESISIYQLLDNLLQMSKLIFNTIPTKFHHLFCFSILEPRRVKYHISFRDIRAKHNRSILHLQFYSDKISSSFSFRDIRTKYKPSILYLQFIKFGILFGLTIQWEVDNSIIKFKTTWYFQSNLGKIP